MFWFLFLSNIFSTKHKNFIKIYLSNEKKYNIIAFVQEIFFIRIKKLKFSKYTSNPSKNI